MKLSVKSFKRLIQRKTTIFCFAALLLSPVATIAQDDDSEPTETSTGSGPWENSAGSTIGSGGNALSEGTARPADPTLSGGSGTAARPAAGPTVDATGGPGGNPDVPFDSNMNLVFLAAGVAFAFMVYKRRLKLKAVPSEK